MTIFILATNHELEPYQAGPGAPGTVLVLGDKHYNLLIFYGEKECQSMEAA